MKRFKKLVSLMAAAAIMALLPNVNALQVSAAEPTVFYVKYDSDLGEWRMQIGGWVDEDPGKETYYLNEGSEKVKDGDTLIVLASDEQANGGEDITVNARLGNLTVNRAGVVINAAGGVDECHVLGDSYAAITGNVTNAYVYDNGTCTFHSNVTNMRLVAVVENDVQTTVTVGGTVNYASVSNAGGILREYYNFKAGTFDFDGVTGLMTDPGNYSTSGSGPAAGAPAAGQTQAQAQPQASAPSSSGEYDDVPKTGEDNLIVWLFAISAACLAGSLALRKAKF